jgi:hypothetical protein
MNVLLNLMGVMTLIIAVGVGVWWLIDNLRLKRPSKTYRYHTDSDGIEWVTEINNED